MVDQALTKGFNIFQIFTISTKQIYFCVERYYSAFKNLCRIHFNFLPLNDYKICFIEYQPFYRKHWFLLREIYCKRFNYFFTKNYKSVDLLIADASPLFHLHISIKSSKIIDLFHQTNDVSNLSEKNFLPVSER